jgi:hypothetical protein
VHEGTRVPVADMPRAVTASPSPACSSLLGWGSPRSGSLLPGFLLPGFLVPGDGVPGDREGAREPVGSRGRVGVAPHHGQVTTEWTPVRRAMLSIDPTRQAALPEAERASLNPYWTAEPMPGDFASALRAVLPAIAAPWALQDQGAALPLAWASGVTVGDLWRAQALADLALTRPEAPGGALLLDRAGPNRTVPLLTDWLVREMRKTAWTSALRPGVVLRWQAVANAGTFDHLEATWRLYDRDSGSDAEALNAWHAVVTPEMAPLAYAAGLEPGEAGDIARAGDLTDVALLGMAATRGLVLPPQEWWLEPSTGTGHAGVPGDWRDEECLRVEASMPCPVCAAPWRRHPRPDTEAAPTLVRGCDGRLRKL